MQEIALWQSLPRPCPPKDSKNIPSPWACGHPAVLQGRGWVGAVLGGAGWEMGKCTEQGQEGLEEPLVTSSGRALRCEEPGPQGSSARRLCFPLTPKTSFFATKTPPQGLCWALSRECAGRPGTPTSLTPSQGSPQPRPLPAALWHQAVARGHQPCGYRRGEIGAG